MSDLIVLALAVVFAAGGVVAQLHLMGRSVRLLSDAVKDLRVEFTAALADLRLEFHGATTALTDTVGDLRERTSSLEAFRDYLDTERGR